LGCCGDCLRRGGRDRHNNIRPFAYELTRDLGRGRRVILGALVLETQIAARLVAVGDQLITNTVPSRIERGMLDDRRYRYECLILGRGRSNQSKRGGRNCSTGQQGEKLASHPILPWQTSNSDEQ